MKIALCQMENRGSVEKNLRAKDSGGYACHDSADYVSGVMDIQIHSGKCDQAGKKERDFPP